MHLLHSLLVFYTTFILALAQNSPLSFPPPLGPHKVGTTTLFLPAKPVSNGAPPRDIMVSIFYPTFAFVNTTTHPLTLAYDTGYAGFLASSFGITVDLVAGLTSRAFLGAPIDIGKGKDGECSGGKKHPDVIVFEAGYRNSRLDYTVTLSNLASRGYIVIAADHPNDTAHITYPSGPLLNPLGNVNDTIAAHFVSLRLQDLNFVLDTLSAPNTAAKIPGLKSRLDTSRVAIFGHSLGGATAAFAILSNGKNGAGKRFVGGLNIDGPIFFPEQNAKGKNKNNKPFLILAAQNNSNAPNSFPAWNKFWKERKGGFEKEIQVKGAGHTVFSDLGVFYTILRKMGLIGEMDPTGEGFGVIGERVWGVLEGVLTAFTEFVFTGEMNALLEGPSEMFPELVFNKIEK